MNYLIIGLAALTFISTLGGGLITLKFKESLHYFFAFAAGTLVAVAFFNLLPESILLANLSGVGIRSIMIVIVVSFFVYSLFERFFPHHEIEKEHDHGHGHIMGPIGAGSLILHSFLDGVAIGAAFRVNSSIGILVALAVIFHDFTDGINTVTIMLKNKQKIFRTKLFLFFDAIAPILGVLLTSYIVISDSLLAILLAVFVGEFLYIGVATLLPETYEQKSKKIIIPMALGIILIFVLSSFLNI